MRVPQSQDPDSQDPDSQDPDPQGPESQDKAVADHYVAYPYPARDPADEGKRLIEGSPSRLAEVEHYLFQGRLPSPFRVLVAGGGTGDGAIQLAQHMASRGVEGEVVWLDLSPASRAVAEARAGVRGLNNIRFVQGSLLEAKALVGGDFDYVDCCGVLHHLDAPEAGLAALKAVLKPAGGMGVMVYGALGRRGVYDMQEMAETLAPTDLAPEQRLAIGQRLFKDLPPSNWLRRNPFVRDHLDGGEAGFYDLLLHARDRAYTVRDFIALAASASMSVVSFIEPARYDPAAYLTDPKLLATISALSPQDQAIFAERLAGNMTTHVAYLADVARAGEATAQASDLQWVPVLRDPETRDALANTARSGKLVADTMGVKLTRSLPRRAPAILRRVDGVFALSAILRDIQAADAGLTEDAFLRDFQALFRGPNGLNLMWLRRAD